jgi:hypothetical protein
MRGPEGEFHSQFSEKLQGRNLIIGAMLSPFPVLRLACAWHGGLHGPLSSTRYTWKIDADGGKVKQTEESRQAFVVIPQQYALGAMLRPSDWFDVSVEYSRLNWQDGQIDGYFGDGKSLPFPQKNDWPDQGQQPVRNLRFGAEARAPFRSWLFSLRGGWSSERQLCADASGDAVCIKSFAAGAGCEFSRNLLIEVTYQRQRSDWSERGFFAGAPDVITKYRAHVFFLAITYRFGHVFKE